MRISRAAPTMLRQLTRRSPRALSTARRFSGNTASLNDLSLRGDPPTACQKEVWDQIWDEAAVQFKTQSWKSGDLQEFGMDRYLHTLILSHKTLACGLAHSLGGRLQSNAQANGGADFIAIFRSAFRADPEICDAVAADLQRFTVVDPAVEGLLGVYCFFKGAHATACARVAHHYWTDRGDAGKLIARLLQSETSDVFGVDIHPGAKLGKGVTMDHATGITIGETAVIGDCVYLMHDVTLGATGTSGEHDRHPKIGSNVFLGAKCTILGNIEIGEGATVAAAALVNKPVPAGYTAVGVPAKLIPPSKAIDVGKAK